VKKTRSPKLAIREWLLGYKEYKQSDKMGFLPLVQNSHTAEQKALFAPLLGARSVAEG
jgi:hypothetical protein